MPDIKTILVLAIIAIGPIVPWIFIVYKKRKTLHEHPPNKVITSKTYESNNSL